MELHIGNFYVKDIKFGDKTKFENSTLKVDLVWSLADCFNAMMVIPNIIGVLALSGTVSVLYNEYQKFKKDK